MTLAQVQEQNQYREKPSKKREKSKFLFVSSDSRGTHAMQGFLEAINAPKFNQIVA